MNVASIKRVRDAGIGVDLLDVSEGKLFQRLSTDPVALIDTLYVLCADQAKTYGVSDEDFGRMMAGDLIESASQALIEAVVAFTPNPKVRAALGNVAAKTRQAQDRAVEVAVAHINSPRMDEAINRELEKMDAEMAAAIDSGGTSGSSPDQSA